MRFQITTRVQGTPKTVFQHFDQRLFDQLTPPGMKVHLIRFDPPTVGVGGIVHVKLTALGIIRQEWYTTFTEYSTSEDLCYFVDQGQKLPPMMKSWQHRHIIRKTATGSEIIDDVTFQGRNPLMSLLLYPIIYLQFRYRKPIYRRYFALQNTKAGL